MKNIILTVMLFAVSMGAAVFLNGKINGIDEAVFQYMKDEHNSKVSAED